MSIAMPGGKSGGAVVLGMADNEPEDSTSMVHGKMAKTKKLCSKKCKKNHKCNKKCFRTKSKKSGGGDSLLDFFNFNSSGKSCDEKYAECKGTSPQSQSTFSSTSPYGQSKGGKSRRKPRKTKKNKSRRRKH